MKLEQLKGIKEYMPKKQVVREKIIDVLKKNFRKYGFRPVETSILERYEIAASKYAGGEEILKEVYKLKDQANRNLILRYELTFKLAKLIGLNLGIRMPFKRYEIGKVFRNGPVKTGRLREFTQCDVDIVGSNSLMYDAEFMALTQDVFNQLNLDITIKINNRKLLFGMIESLKIKKDPTDIILILDKLDKIGKKEVMKELKQMLNPKTIKKLFEFIEIEGSNKEKLNYFEKINNETVKQAVSELREFFDYCDSMNVKVEFYPALARGLAYYTSMMWEVYLKNSLIKSSVAAGGRWDNMIQKFLQSKQEYPATGMTFGLDVIYEALKEKQFQVEKIPKVLVIPIGTLKQSLSIISELRKNNINSDITDKPLKKALDYANKEEIPYCIILGQQESREKKLKLKNMTTGEEKLMALSKVVKELK